MGLKLHLSKNGIGSHLNGDDQLTIVIGRDRPVCAIKDHGQVDPSSFFVVSAMHFKILQSPQNFILEPRHLQVFMMDPQLRLRENMSQNKNLTPKELFFNPVRKTIWTKPPWFCSSRSSSKKGILLRINPGCSFQKKNQTRICVQGAPIWAGHFWASKWFSLWFVR